MTNYSSISIIYNPNSTGPSQDMAEELKVQLKRSGQRSAINLIPTQRAGHAEELAYEIAKKEQQPLIVSSSGDGGYHEVINGALRAQDEGGAPICAVLPAGNANDHRRLTRRQPLAAAIQTSQPRKLDVLTIIIRTSDGTIKQRYAHSYLGLGLTPAVATELNRHTLNAFREIITVIKAFHQFRPFTIKLDGKKVAMDSLVISNVKGMAKVLTLASDGKASDGKFEVNIFPHAYKLRLISRLIRAATIGLKPSIRTDHYRFYTLKPMPMQLDGEITQLVADCEVIVEAAPGKLHTLT